VASLLNAGAWRRRPVLLLATALVAALAYGAWSRSPGAHAARGARLFDGREALDATLADHAIALPSGSVRCSQCHTGPGGTPPGGAPSPGPRLDRASLRDALPRRGGPPAAYELATFCRTVRTGIDPSHVVLPRSMPRFTIDDARCEALWTYLTQAPA
jgi:mono/diheme cytochrome c family protein